LQIDRFQQRHGLQMSMTGVMTIPRNVLRPLSSLRKWLLDGGRGWVAMRTVAVLLATLLTSALVHHRHPMLLKSFLWPNSNVHTNPKIPNEKDNAPLPPGSLGCPWLGSNILAGSQRRGPEYFYRQESARLGDPRVWKSYFLGSPYVVVSGKEWVQQVNNLEFSQTTSLAAPKLTTTSEDDKENGMVNKRKLVPKKNTKPVVFGRNNLMFESNKDKHAFLRKLVGSAMTPQALKKALPTIQQTALDVIEREVVQPLLANTTANNQMIQMEDVCVDYTMDIVQRQFLGLNLPPSEVDTFRDKLKIWTKAFFSLVGLFNIPWLVTRSAPYQAKLYIESKLEDKIDSLLQNGPDNTSIISNMLFAVDNDKDDTDIGSVATTKNNKLSREEVVENALLLVLAGAETSAGTLTLAMLLLGLHPDKYSQLVNEQEKVVQEHGEELTQAILDKECPYLDAVVKEALRMGPITGGFPRRTLETIVVDGVKIPKDWLIFTTVRLTHQLDPVSRLPEDAHMDAYEGFQPERWLQFKTTPSDFIPFGAGPRYCIGSSLAMMEMKVFLAVLARRVSYFELTPNCGGANTKKPVKWNPSTITPRPLEGVTIQSIAVVQR
jgi:cytochrome P450